MLLDSALELVVNRPERQLPLEFLEGLFHFMKLKVKLPKFCGLGLLSVCTQQVAPLPSPSHPQRAPFQLVTQCRHLAFPLTAQAHTHLHMAGIPARLFFGRSKGLMELVPFQRFLRPFISASVLRYLRTRRCRIERSLPMRASLSANT